MKHQIRRRRYSPAEIKALLLKSLVYAATDYAADPTDKDAAYSLDQIKSALVQHHGMTYEEVRAIIAAC